MKKFYSLLVLLTFACSNDDDLLEQFNNANSNGTPQKLIKEIVVTQDRDKDTLTFSINYNLDSLVSTVNSDEGNLFFNYDPNSDSLNSVLGQRGLFDVIQLYSQPFDAFKTGDVISYYPDGNPEEIIYYEGWQRNILRGKVTYDSTPNPFFYSLQAAGIIDALNRVDLYFGTNGYSPMIKAINVLPFNGIRSIVLRDISGVFKYEMDFQHTYDSEGYPIQTSLFLISTTSRNQITFEFDYY